MKRTLEPTHQGTQSQESNTMNTWGLRLLFLLAAVTTTWVLLWQWLESEEWTIVAPVLAYFGFAFLLFAPVLTIVLQVHFRRRMDSVRYHLIDAIAQRERLDSPGDDAFGDLSREIQTAIEKLHARLASLEQETDQLATLLSSMEEAVVMTNDHERVLVANPKAVEWFDLVKRSKETRGTSWKGRRLSELTSYRPLTDLLSHVLWKGEPRIEELVYMEQALHEKYYYTVSSSPIRNHNDVVVGAVVVLYDVTRLRRLEQVRRDFVANVSHELRTPIASIKSSAETLLMPNMDLSPVAFEFTKVIVRNADRMGETVEDLLTLSVMEAQGDTIDVSEIHLPAIFAEMWDRFAPSAKQAGLLFDIELPEEIPAILAESRTLIQAIGNLIENAIKYTPSGGSVWLSAEQKKREVMILVRDNGLGIPQEHLPRIFERFYRVDKGRSRDIGGTGLGLSIVKHSVRMMHGRVTVRSIPGETVFSIILPMVVPGKGNLGEEERRGGGDAPSFSSDPMPVGVLVRRADPERNTDERRRDG